MGTAQDFIRSYLDAWNEHDADGVAGHLCDGGLYCDEPLQQEMSREALVSHLIDYFISDRYHYDIIGDILFSNSTIAFQYRARGSCRDAPDSGWSGAEFIRLDGGAAAHISDYYRLPDASDGDAGADERGARVTRRYAKSGLSHDAMQQLLGRLAGAMRDERLYLDPELSLPRLAEHLGCSINHLSQAINAGHSMSFFDYINRHRVDDAAAMLRQEDCQFPAILDVALSVGFNSTSTFYTAFKKATGQTPARFRREAQSVS